MSVRIGLTCVDGSADFTKRSLVLPAGGHVKVARAGGEDQPEEDNAVFDSRVLSRAQAVLSSVNGQILLKDIGSRNGTFINGFRLSKPFQESGETPVYSQDVIRFGTQSKTVKEKCIFAELKISLSSGEEFGSRPSDDRLIKPITTDHIYDDVTKEDEVNDEDKTNQDEENRAIPNNDTKNLKESVNKLKAGEDKMLMEICELKKTLESKEMDSIRVADGIDVQKDKLTELENKLQEKEKILQRTFNENAQLRTELDGKYTNLEAEMRKCTEEIHFQKEKVDHLNKLLFDSDASVEDKEKEILRLIQLLNKDESQIQEKDGAYQELETLITEEDETLQQAETEMRRLLDIIADDQENILSKDKQILTLQNSIQEKDELITKECTGISKQEMECLFKKTMDEQTLENEKVINEIKACVEERESELSSLTDELDEQKNINKEKDLEIEELKDTIESQQERVKTHEALKRQCEELIKIIMKQKSEMEATKNDFPTHDVVSSRNEIMQKEILVLKVAIQQKDMDIKSLNELLEIKEEIISENTQTEPKQGKLTKQQDSLEDPELTIQNLQQKIMNEQEINDQSEVEIIQLRMDITELEKEIENKSERKLSTDEDSCLLESKDREIEKLKSEVLKDQKIIDDIKVLQRNEIIEKEKEIYALNKVLKEERQEWLKREKEMEQLKKNKAQGEPINEAAEDTETVTIDDNYSDEEEEDYVLVEELGKSST